MEFCVFSIEGFLVLRTGVGTVRSLLRSTKSSGPASRRQNRFWSERWFLFCICTLFLGFNFIFVIVKNKIWLSFCFVFFLQYSSCYIVMGLMWSRWTVMSTRACAVNMGFLAIQQSNGLPKDLWNPKSTKIFRCPLIWSFIFSPFHLISKPVVLKLKLTAWCL